MANTTYDTIKNMKPAPWSRSTVADGNALNQNFLEPTHQKDLTLAAAIDQVKNTVDGYNETINTINGIANNAKDLATEAISEVNEVSTVVEEHQEALNTLNYNVNSLSSSMVEVVTDITNLENNKQDKIYVDPTTIAGSGTHDSPYTVIGGGDGSNKVYIPEVDEYTGELSYVLSSTSGAQSPLGPWHVKPLLRIATESKEWEISYNGGITWENTHVNAEGIPGYSPTFVIEDIPESQDPDALHKNGGTKITIKYGDGEYDTTSYSAWNGNNGSMANAPDIEGTNGLSATYNGSKYFVGLSGKMEIGKIYAVTTSGVEEMPIEYSIDGRLCSIGEDNKFVYESGGMNDVLLQGYANSGTYEDFAQGYENSAFQYSLVQGRYNKAHSHSLAQGYHNIASSNSFAQGNENTAEEYALAQGSTNSAVYRAMAQGITNTASGYSFAQGVDNNALKFSLSQGAGNRAEIYSIAQGQENRAFRNSQAFGLSTIASGSSIDGHHYGMMSIGSFNETTAGALFVIGNGYSQDAIEHRSDAFAVYKDGTVIEGVNNTNVKLDGLTDTNHIEGAFNQVSGVYDHMEGHANKVYGYGIHMQGGYNQFYINNVSADTSHSDPTDRWNIWGQSIEGMANATTAEPTSGTEGQSDFGYVHGGILKVIGNGTRTVTTPGDPSTEVIDRSDALILYRDGSMWVKGPISANGVELGGGFTPTLSLNIGTGNTVVDDGKCVAIGNRCNVSGNSFAVNDDNKAWDNSFAFGWNCSAKNYSMAGGNIVSAFDYSLVFGHGSTTNQDNYCVAGNYSIAVGDACEAYNYSQAFGRGVKFTGNSNNGKGGLAIGGWNKTTTDALFVIGNGTGNGNLRNDAMVVDYTGNTRFNGSLSACVATGQNIIAVASAASLIGASRQTSANFGQNNDAMGTTWMGVGSEGMYRGFLKYTQGGTVGALDSNNTMQVEFTPSNKGQLFAKAKNGGTDCPETQILNPTKASCDAMATSANANLVSGPNYMLAKNADGQFTIGAGFVNCTDMNNVTLTPNTYYFVYEV